MVTIRYVRPARGREALALALMLMLTHLGLSASDARDPFGSLLTRRRRVCYRLGVIARGHGKGAANGLEVRHRSVPPYIAAGRMILN